MAQRAWENESATELTVRQRSPKAPFYFWISPLSDLMGLRQLYWCWPSVLTLCCDCLILVKIISLWPLCLLGVNMWRRTRLRYMDCVTQRQITRWWDSGLTFDRPGQLNLSLQNCVVVVFCSPFIQSFETVCTVGFAVMHVVWRGICRIEFLSIICWFNTRLSQQTLTYLNISGFNL